jgi:excisionase family DNA binding protein
VLTVAEAAAFLKCGPKAIRRLARVDRKFSARRIDAKGTLRISREALEQWLKEVR